MKPSSLFVMTCLLVGAVVVTTTGARAEGVASSASSTGSASVGSVSGSIQRSSASSSGDGQVAEGDYRVIEVAASPHQPGVLRLTLQDAAGGGFVLELPTDALALRALAVDDKIAVSHRPYGLGFAYADTRQDFYLVLSDDWRRDLDPRPVTL